MNIDLVCAWPTHLDYPLFRKFIHENRNRFQKVIILMTHMNTKYPDLTEQLKEKMNKDQVSIYPNDPVPADRDWRDVAMNKALTISDAEWVWFMEQDFFITNPKFFWEIVDEAMCETYSHYHHIHDPAEVVGVLQDTRLHPCCLLIKRETLDKTSKYFGVIKDKSDHFSQIQIDLEEMKAKIWYIKDGWHHMNGLSQNLFMKMNGETPNYNPAEFEEYLKEVEKYEKQT